MAPPIVHDVLRSPGAPLEPSIRSEMEPRFGHSFADVRVHADASAAESARAVGAHAYAVGRDVVFAAGRYAPGSVDGRRLIAHELAHVVQQRGSASAALQPMLEVGAVGDPAEREADRAADAVMGGGAPAPAPAAGAPAAVRRKDDRWQDPNSVTFGRKKAGPEPSVHDESTMGLFVRVRLDGRVELLVRVPGEMVDAFAVGLGVRIQNGRWAGFIGTEDPLDTPGDSYSAEEGLALLDKVGGEPGKDGRGASSAVRGLPRPARGRPEIVGPHPPEYGRESLATRNLRGLTERLSRNLRTGLERARRARDFQLADPQLRVAPAGQRPRLVPGLAPLPMPSPDRFQPAPVEGESSRLIPGLPLSLQLGQPGAAGPAAPEPALYRSAFSAAPALAPPIVHDVLRSPGAPLEPSIRSEMEPRFGHSFADVRVHADGTAAESARAVGAHAYAVGRDVVFAAGRYAPGSVDGRRLIAHELAHVVQQRGSASASLQPKLEIGAVGDPAEREAEGAADRVLSHAPSAGAPPTFAGTPDAPRLRRLGDLSLVPPGLACPVAGTTSAPPVLSVLFAENSSTLTPADRASIEGFISSWRALDGTSPVRVDGFASTLGGDGPNWTLSCNRAQAVAAELRAPSSGAVPGVPAALVQVFAQGETAEFPGGEPANQRATLSTNAAAPPAPVVPAPAVPAPGVTACTTPANPDRSGRAFNPTTDSEAFMIASHPIDALTVNSLAGEAVAAAGASGFAGPHLGPFDAFRHCVWNCRMAQELGAARAEEFATAHENSGPSPIPFDNQMDLHNNFTGRALGTPGADCGAVCQTAVTSGTLRTVRRPATVPPGPAAAPCLGASDQPWP